MINFFCQRFPEQYRKCLTTSTSHPMLKQYLSTSLTDKNTYVKDVEFLAVDFETTGLNVGSDRIVSMGYTLIKQLHLSIKESRHFLVHPKSFMTEHSVAIHQITDDEVAEGISISQMMEILLHEMHNRVLLVHFEKVERGFINSICQKLYHLNCLPMRIVDTLQLESIKQIRLQGFLNHSNLRLFTLREQYNLPTYKAHNAMQDAIATAELLLAQLSYMGNINQIQLKELL